MPSHYFDHAATTPVDPRVLREMLPYFSESYGNPHSIHEPGQRARAAVERARRQVAALIGAEDPHQIVFTSGATESNQWALRLFPGGTVSPFEHSSVREPALRLGYRIAPASGPEIQWPEAPGPLVSLMKVGNELGTIFAPEALCGQGFAVHCDATQAVGKVPFEVAAIDFVSLSAHKFYGPKGVGALYLREGLAEPFVIGGGQEEGRRGGTLNVPGIAGMGLAAEFAAEERDEAARQAEACRAALLEALRPLSDWRVHGSAPASPFILSLGFLGIEGQPLVVELDHLGFAVSSGAACSSTMTEPSPVLEAMGIEEAWRPGTLRISFGKANTPASADALGKAVYTCVEKIRNLE